jgi:hypothetical protein
MGRGVVYALVVAAFFILALVVLGALGVLGRREES